MRRTLTWLVTLPFAAASVVLGHAIAYRRHRHARPAGMHDYLAHAPQVVFILASLAVLGLAADSRARRHSPVPLAALGVGAFVAQEHLERLIHTGHVPFLLASPVLWLGIALQLPLAVAIWLVARRLAEDIAAPVRRAARRVPRLVHAARPARSAAGRLARRRRPARRAALPSSPDLVLRAAHRARPHHHTQERFHAHCTHHRDRARRDRDPRRRHRGRRRSSPS